MEIYREIPQSVVDRIVNFSPGQKVAQGETLVVGEFPDGLRVDYRWCTYPARFVGDPTEPYLLSVNLQPTLVLEKVGKDGKFEICRPLPYGSEVRALGSELAFGVWDRIIAYNAGVNVRKPQFIKTA